MLGMSGDTDKMGSGFTRSPDLRFYWALEDLNLWPLPRQGTPSTIDYLRKQETSRSAAPHHVTPLPHGAGAATYLLPRNTAMTSPGTRLVEIAELLGVSKQRAHQIAEAKGFRTPLAEDARGRVWSRTRSRHGRSVGDARSPGASSSGSTN